MIRRCRGDHSRLGYALMLCYLRCPGRPLRIGERPPAALVSFVAEQIEVQPESLDDYLGSEQNRRRHAAELQDRLRLRPFRTRPAAELAVWLLPRAIENDRLVHLAELVMEECRRRRIVVPPPRRLERLCVDLRLRRSSPGSASVQASPKRVRWRVRRASALASVHRAVRETVRSDKRFVRHRDPRAAIVALHGQN
jgi:Domain of unknown function (DUF4158)